VAENSLDRFVSRFVLPLVVGGPVYVDNPLGPGVVAEWTRWVRPDVGVLTRVTDTMRKRLAHLGPMGELGDLPIDALTLAAVWHNLLTVTHPSVVDRKPLRAKVRTWCDAMLGWLDVPRTRAEATLRHGLLGRLGTLGRVDTHVEFWAGYADFIGVAPPTSLVAWPDLRRVKVQKARVDLMQLLRGLDQGAGSDPATDLRGTVRAAFAASPLTDLLLVDRAAPFAFVWTAGALNCLGDEALRGAIARGLLGRGAGALRALEYATLSVCRGGTTVPVARALVRLHLELAMLDAMTARLGPVPGGANATSPTAFPQPLALDLAVSLGARRVSEFLGVSEDLVLRTLPPDPARPPPREPPSAPLLAAAALMEAPL